MKKENKKMAQERRARERRKKEIQRKISKTIVILIPLIAVIALFIAIAITSADSASDTDANTDTSTDSSTDTDTTADNSTDIDTDNDSAGYSTDASLTVEDGDTVNIDYVGSVDGVEFEGGSTQGQGTDLVIGSGSYIDDFEEQLIGAHPGDEIDVYATFPDPYNNNPDLSGKEALFEVTINGIYE